MKLRILALAAVLLGVCALGALADTHPDALGVNIGHGSRFPGVWTDFQKENYRWYKLPEWTDITSADVDADGWPTCDADHLWDYRPVNEWDAASGMDDPEAYRWDFGGTWQCSFVGQADLNAWTGEGWTDGITIQNKVYNSQTNTTTFEMVIPNCDGPGDTDYGLFGLDFLNTKRTPQSATNTGITNFRMMFPGYSLSTSQLFTTEYLDCLGSASWPVVRYMCFTEANNETVTYPDVTTWAERKLTTHASQANMKSTLPNVHQCGSWEYLIELANASGIDPWINVPVSADTNYVTQLATLLKNDLDNGLDVYVESSNEVWNGGFPQYGYNQDQAAALGISGNENHARRTAELAQIFAGVFGSSAINDRVRVVLCHHQPMVDWDIPGMMQYIQDNFGAPKDIIWGMASQLYFNAGPQGTVQQLLADCEAAITDQIPIRQAWVATANAYELPGGYMSYEGGPDALGDIGSTTNVANRIMTHRDPGMEAVSEYNYDEAFAALGGTLAMQFTMDGAYSRYGCWGLTDDCSDPDRNWKFKGARDILGDSTYKNGTWSPVAVADSYSVSPGSQLSVSAPGVLGNDSDADPISAVLVTDVQHGSLTLNANGSFTYTPDAGFTGQDRFEYAADDGTLDSNDGVVTIAVTPGYTPADCHVQSIVAWWRDNGSLYVPAADVVIVDNGNMPVQGAWVQISLKDGCTVKWGLTNAYGVANVTALGGECHVRSPKQAAGADACVLDVVHALPYDPADNVVSCCDSNGDCTGPGDTTPPAAPTNLSATAVGPSQIDLDWDDNTEPDLAGYNVYRDTVQIASGVAQSQYSDNTCSPNTTYCYTVTAVDTSENESDHSNQDCATTPDAPAMHVDSITVTIVPVAGPRSKAVAEVVIVDEFDAPVESATVTGTFTGDISGSGSDETDANGLAVVESAAARNVTSVTFCVDGVTHATLIYDPEANVETCDTN
jgi:hypothetical protein